MAGYAARTLKLEFPELSEDPETDPVWVVIRNPRIMPPDALLPPEPEASDDDSDDEGTDGKKTAVRSTLDTMYEIFSRLILAWRVYDTTDIRVDEETGEPLEQARLDLPASVEQIRKLPQEILGKLTEQVVAANNPR